MQCIKRLSLRGTFPLRVKSSIRRHGIGERIECSRFASARSLPSRVDGSSARPRPTLLGAPSRRNRRLAVRRRDDDDERRDPFYIETYLPCPSFRPLAAISPSESRASGTAAVAVSDREFIGELVNAINGRPRRRAGLNRLFEQRIFHP